MYHYLAAQSWLDDRSFAIADGEYLRARLFTILSAAFMSLFGESLIAARLPSVLTGALGVALLYRFTSAQAGRTTGLIAAALLCFHPLSIYVGQLARFYAPHELCFWVGAYGLFKALERPALTRTNVAWLVVALASLALAFHLQITTIVGIGAAMVWFGMRFGWVWLQRLFRGDRRAPWVWAATLAICGVTLLVAWRAGLIDYLLDHFRASRAWAREHATDEGYYHRLLMRETPVLWTLFPVAVVIAISRQRTFSFFCATVFAVVFVTHSLAGDKAPRFIYYAMPFLFVIWGIALAEALGWFRPILREVVVRGFELPPSNAVARTGTLLAGCSVVGMILLTNPATGMTFRMLAQSDAAWRMPHHYRGFADWESAAPGLKPLADESSVVLASSGVKALHFLGRSDFDISFTVMHETDTKAEFGMDPRTGRRVISSAESLATLMSQHPDGLIVIEAPQWRVPHNVPPDIADFIEANTEPVPLKKEWRLMAFRWKR